jgi:hypothetical protein
MKVPPKVGKNISEMEYYEFCMNKGLGMEVHFCNPCY